MLFSCAPLSARLLAKIASFSIMIVPRTVVALGLVSLLTDLSSEMIYPLLPAFLATLLGAGVVALGIVEGAAEATASLLKIVSGTVADRVRRRKPLIIAGYAVSGVARPLIGFAVVWPMVLALRVVDRIGKGLRTAPRDALIADVTVAEARGRAYGLHRAMDNAGAVLGPLIATALLAAGLSVREVFWSAAVPAGIVIAVLALSVRESPRPAFAVSTRTGSLARLGKLGPRFPRLLVVFVIFALGNSTDAFFLLRLHEAGLAPAAVALTWAAHSAVRTVAVYCGGALADRMDRRKLLATGWLLYATIYGAMAAVDSVAALVALLVVYGLHYGAVEPTERALVAELAPPALRGSAFGWFHGAVGLAALPASALFGLLWNHAGAAAAFGFGAALAALAALLLLVWAKA
jgi:MFS family permease